MGLIRCHTSAQQLLRWATVWPEWAWAESGERLLWGLSPRLTQCGLGRGLPLYQVTSWSIQPFGNNSRNATLQLRTIFCP